MRNQQNERRSANSSTESASDNDPEFPCRTSVNALWPQLLPTGWDTDAQKGRHMKANLVHQVCCTATPIQGKRSWPLRTV
mmetsp:Transcript_65034/g.107988  ORF Transcript_65034/g.107988 Transcript_65034/m.107988 type:complete len:80 (+) Transcript_65034:310-549(+)